MTNGNDGAVGPSIDRRAVVLGLGRSQERHLLAACREDPRLRVVARCSSAPEVLASIQHGAADVALLDEDLHLLDEEHLGHFEAVGTPTLILVREPDAEQWQHWRSLTLLSVDAETADVLLAIHEARNGRPRVQPWRMGQEWPPSVARAIERPGHLQVFSFWSGPGSPGRTTLAINWGVLLGWVARTVIVDLNLTAAAVTAQLDQTRPEPGRRGWVASSILQLASANPDSADSWGHEIFRVARPVGPLSPHADLLAGVLQPWLRQGISASFVERLISELRRHYTYVLLDLGDEPLGEPTRESAVNAAALRAADQIVVVCPPDGPGLHQTYMALAQAGSIVDRGRAGLVVNRYDPRYHQAEMARIEEALELPLVGVLPVDTVAVQRALAEGRPVVCDPRSKLRRPLQDLAERVHGGRVEIETKPRKYAGIVSPRRLRAAVTGLMSAAGAAVSGLSALGGAR
jgi:MinD-like ATPase involved in chromosome partitioning or flagellar assembly